MAKYRKKPIEVEAFKWTGGPDQTEDPEWIVEALRKDFFTELGGVRIIQPRDKIVLEIFTPEGRESAAVGDYVIRDDKGKIRPCKSDIFEQTYELVEEQTCDRLEQQQEEIKRLIRHSRKSH